MTGVCLKEQLRVFYVFVPDSVPMMTVFLLVSVLWGSMAERYQTIEADVLA